MTPENASAPARSFVPVSYQGLRFPPVRSLFRTLSHWVIGSLHHCLRFPPVRSLFKALNSLQSLLVGEAALIDGAAFSPLEHELAEPRAGVDRQRPAG